MLDLLKKEQQHLADLEDAVVVTKNSQGKIGVKPYYDLLAAVQGHRSQFWGSIVSSLLETSDPETLSKIGLTEKIRFSPMKLKMNCIKHYLRILIKAKILIYLCTIKINSFLSCLKIINQEELSEQLKSKLPLLQQPQ